MHQLQWMQCTLPMNIYLEKMYLIVWVWSLILFFLTVFNIFRYIYFCTCGKKNIYNDYFEGYSNIGDLNIDTLVVLKLIKENTSTFDIHNVIESLNNLNKNN